MRHAVVFAFAMACLVVGLMASISHAGEMVDTREEAPRTEVEKAFILDQMRLLLNAIMEIEEGLGTGDMDLVAREAAARGRRANVILARPPSLAAKESEAWKSMFLSVRNGFDAVADLARDRAPAASINKTLADTLRNCVACHQTYRIVETAR